MGASYLKIYTSIITCIGLGVLLPVFFMDGKFELGMFIFYAITFYAALRLALIILSEKIKMLETTFYIFVYVFFGIAPLSQVLMHEFPWAGKYYSPNLILLAGLTVAVGIIFYEIGLFWGRNKKENQVLRPTKVHLKLISSIGIMLCIFTVFARGGFQNLFLPRNELSATIESMQIDTTSSLILTVLIRVPIFIAFMFALLKYLDKKNKNILLKSNTPLILLLIFLGVLTLVVNNPISTSRYWVGTVYLGIFFTLIRWNRLTQPLIIIVVLTVLLFIFPYADIFRNSLDVELEISPLPEIMSGKGDYDSFQQVMNVIEYVSYNGLSWGMQFLGVLLFWVPRTIWPDKPLGTGLTVSEEMGFAFTNVSAPLWSEFYINFGIIGVIVMFVLYGYVCARLQINYELSRKLKGINFYRLFVPIYAAYQLFLLRGDLLSSFSYLAPVFIFIVIGFGFKMFKKPPKYEEKGIIIKNNAINRGNTLN